MFTGEEVGSESLRNGGRCVGGTTSVALSLLAVAQSNGASFGFDFDNYETSKTEQGAKNLLSCLKDLVYKLGFVGFSFKLVSLTNVIGIQGVSYDTLHGKYSHLNPALSFGVLVRFDPLVEVHYDLRK
jgi:hypothetical protein